MSERACDGATGVGECEERACGSARDRACHSACERACPRVTGCVRAWERVSGREAAAGAARGRAGTRARSCRGTRVRVRAAVGAHRAPVPPCYLCHRACVPRPVPPPVPPCPCATVPVPCRRVPAAAPGRRSGSARSQPGGDTWRCRLSRRAREMLAEKSQVSEEKGKSGEFPLMPITCRST